MAGVAMSTSPSGWFRSYAPSPKTPARTPPWMIKRPSAWLDHQSALEQPAQVLGLDPPGEFFAGSPPAVQKVGRRGRLCRGLNRGTTFDAKSAIRLDLGATARARGSRPGCRGSAVRAERRAPPHAAAAFGTTIAEETHRTPTFRVAGHSRRTVTPRFRGRRVSRESTNCKAARRRFPPPAEQPPAPSRLETRAARIPPRR